MPKLSFVLAGLFLAAALLGVILLMGILAPKYEPFGANQHTTCGQPVTLRAEGYNILGGTRYGRDEDDPGDDVPLATIDLCHPFVEARPDGDERLWFWFEVEVIGRVFPYAAWGLPWEDVDRINPADDRHPTDPIWNPENVWAVVDPRNGDASRWLGRRAQVCDDWDESGLVQFFNAAYGFVIPYGTTRAGWLCLTFSDKEHVIPLPNAVIVTSRPDRARITRWVDARIQVRASVTGDAPAVPLTVVETPGNVCRYAGLRVPGSFVPGGRCEASP